MLRTILLAIATLALLAPAASAVGTTAGDCTPGADMHLPRVCSEDDGTTCVVAGSYVQVSRCVNLIQGFRGCTELGIGEWQVCNDRGTVCVHGNVGHPPVTHCVSLEAGTTSSARCLVGNGGDGINVCIMSNGDVCTYGSIGHPPYGPYCVPVSALDHVVAPCLVGDGSGNGINVCRMPNGDICTYGSIGHPPYGPYCVPGRIAAQ